MAQAALTMDPVKRITVDPLNDDARRLWETIVRLGHELEDVEGWCLVGGLMVQLFSYEHDARARATTDIDILADARKRPSGTQVVAERLESLGASRPVPTGLDHELSYGFELDGELVEVLAPEGLKRRPRTLGNLQTIEIPGGTQALRDAEVVEVVVAGGAPTLIRRPTLMSALLLKARAVPVHARPDEQLQDVIQLLGFIRDPRAEGDRLKGRQKQWLRQLVGRLDFHDARWRGRFSATHLRRAEQAFRLLTSRA